MKVTRFDESNLFDDLDKIDTWLTGRGFTQRNRLRIYRENLIAMRDTDDDMAKIHSQMQEAGRVNEMLASYVEGFELSDALKCLLDNQVDIPDELMKRSLDGHADAAQETAKSNHGRNAMFELSIAAAVARQGLKPVFNLDKPDLEFQFESRRVLMECKRVLSENGIDEAMSVGIRQLRKKVNVSADDVGLVAVNISRLFNNGDGWWTVKGGVHPVRSLSNMIHRVIEGLEANLRRRKEPAIRGMVFYAASPFKVEGVGYMPVRTATVCRLDSSDALMRRLSDTLKL
jgi:hypothetical protein